jgi:hypothetical protein
LTVARNVLTATCLLAALTACGSTDTPPAPAPTVTVTASPSPSPTPTPEDTPTPEPEPSDSEGALPGDGSVDQRFLAAVRTDGRWPGASDESLISLGHKVCGLLDQGITISQMQAYFAMQIANGSLDASASEVGAIIGGGVVAYCPKYQDQIGVGTGTDA